MEGIVNWKKTTEVYCDKHILTLLSSLDLPWKSSPTCSVQYKHSVSIYIDQSFLDPACHKRIRKKVFKFLRLAMIEQWIKEEKKRMKVVKKRMMKATRNEKSKQYYTIHSRSGWSFKFRRKDFTDKVYVIRRVTKMQVERPARDRPN